ncbi:TetR/AcrR family transcriptional regulator [Sphingomonas sp. G-3-2-10]|uniref:TetR/AcrR family transcriptional regulator n=1 Tax=Sphingomonas sp. G-3-2-10 TaxID=2728838 RepID=UPI00146D45D4|nr:TetR/AcrR family transcriptional regulator [Sphingomonas sp. G-3-2-10]NML07216.1 TetR/AcrR family transcriptional regulator [Sphingomonas sp. G-3-2-10]
MADGRGIAATSPAPGASDPTDSTSVPHSEASAGKEPRTARGRKTLRAILDAAAVEFGEKGFHEGSIAGITRRAGVALGSFYTYFDSKDDVFRALVRDMSEQVKEHVGPAIRAATGQIDAERAGLLEFIKFARSHKEIYRIIDEAEFVDPESFRMHYATTADRIAARLRAAADRGEVRDDISEVHAWAIMGMNVFLGLRYSVWADDSDPEAIADTIASMLARGIAAKG